VLVATAGLLLSMLWLVPAIGGTPERVGVDRLSTSSLNFPLPKSTSASSTIYVSHIGGQRSSLAYTVSALQGIVARSGARIYLSGSPDDSVYWLPLAKQDYGITTVNATAQSLLTTFQRSVENPNGQVKLILFGGASDGWSPQLYEELSIADTLAGVYSALPVCVSAACGSGNDLALVQSAVNKSVVLFNVGDSAVPGELCGSVLKCPTSSSLASGADCTTCVNLTALASDYTWLWNRVRGQVGQQFFSMNPEGRNSLTDYTTEFRAFSFEFCCGPVNATDSALTQNASVRAFLDSLLSSYPEGTADWGYIGLGAETETIEALSTYGDYEVSAGEAEDVSFYSAYPTLGNLSQAPSVQSAVPYNANITYVLVEFTQGDSLPFDFYSNWDRFRAIDPGTSVPYVDEYPAAWQVNPLMAYIAPEILAGWYQGQRGSLDDFITGPSGGAGYDSPCLMPNEAAWGSVDHAVASGVGMNIQFAIFDSCPVYSGGTLQTYISDAQPKALLLWQDDGRAPEIVDGIPVITETCKVGVTCPGNPSGVAAFVQTRAAHGTRFIYLTLAAQNLGMPFVKELAENLSSGFQLVNAQQFIGLWLRSQGIAAPPGLDDFAPSATAAQVLTSLGSATAPSVSTAFRGLVLVGPVFGDSCGSPTSRVLAECRRVRGVPGTSSRPSRNRCFPR
jgi:hypothetical protein